MKFAANAARLDKICQLASNEPGVAYLAGLSRGDRMIYELLSGLEAGELIGLVAVVGGLLSATISIVGMHWRQIRKDQFDAQLKLDMLDRGMSAEEIKAVLEAGKKA